MIISTTQPTPVDPFIGGTSGFFPAVTAVIGGVDGGRINGAAMTSTSSEDGGGGRYTGETIEDGNSTCRMVALVMVCLFAVGFILELLVIIILLARRKKYAD